MVLSNCQQLCAFRVSAADAKIMVEELQEKVTIKHIISLPALHCYARLSLPDYPLQIVSVQLTPSASWLDDPARDAIVDEIRRTSQDRNLPADEVDRRHAAHLHQFLDINAIAGRLQYEARSTRAKKRERDEANQLARDLHAAQVITGTKQPTNATPTAQSSGGVIQTPQQAQEKPPASGHAQNKPTRNHRRSRRMGKKTVGAPPPAPNTTSVNHSLDTTDTERDVNGSSYPLPGAGGRSVAGGGSWGSSMGHEGYEGRERA
jgi:hypothetical protein